MTIRPEADDLKLTYQDKFLALFERVSAQQPEKGIKTLFQRAESLAVKENLSEAEALEIIYQGALERTEQRLALISACKIHP